MPTLGNSRNMHRWPLAHIWKINFPATYLRMMYKTSFYGLCQHNLIRPPNPITSASWNNRYKHTKSVCSCVWSL